MRRAPTQKTSRAAHCTRGESPRSTGHEFSKQLSQRCPFRHPKSPAHRGGERDTRAWDPYETTKREGRAQRNAGATRLCTRCRIQRAHPLTGLGAPEVLAKARTTRTGHSASVVEPARAAGRESESHRSRERPEQPMSGCPRP